MSCSMTRYPVGPTGFADKQATETVLSWRPFSGRFHHPKVHVPAGNGVAKPGNTSEAHAARSQMGEFSQ